MAGPPAQGIEALATADGPITLYPVHHASFVMRWNGHTIYVDPVGPAERYAGLGAPDLVLITHGHGDHLDTDTLDALDTGDALMVMPQAVADGLDMSHGKTRRVMANGDRIDTHGMTVDAMPMYNLPETPDSRHPKGWGNGYVLNMGGKRIYISGDTEGTDEMRALENIDLAFVCMNLPYTMGVEQAADAVAEFAPATVYPYHYRGQDIERFKTLVNQANPNVTVRLYDWYASPDA
ncbi:MBL fold metallo-hydrolase [Salinisphaera sp. T31B1]|uniref:MBL fold metallo-hydrolase n=1 Tax=Salinisphaera sp. T31B1 TaxID=727963 RepID=UPI0033428E26